MLLESLKPITFTKGWFWAGTDLSESASVSEQTLVIRILTDLSATVSSFTIREEERKPIGFGAGPEKIEQKLTYANLIDIYNNAPGLESDKLKHVLEIVWTAIRGRANGIVFAYDEAQNLKDKAADKQYPLSVLLEVMQHLQRKQIPYLLVLTGLPTLFPNLVEARTYAERMFHNITLDKLDPKESRDAIQKPILDGRSPVTFTNEAIDSIVELSGGYPYFIQFFCKELFDSYLQQISVGIDKPVVSLDDIVHKLDIDFYSGRWSKITSRQRDLLSIAAKLENANSFFSIQDIVSKSNELASGQGFKPSYVNQILNRMIETGLIFKSRHGEYSFAVPLLADYIKRQASKP